MERVGVLQVVDTLDAGGMERMVVSIANSLPADRYESHVCMTRRAGILETELSADVRRLNLRRHGRFDLAAIGSLAQYVKRARIRIVHAHGPSLFVCSLLGMFDRSISIVWHDHFGAGHLRGRRPIWAYRLAASRVESIISVTKGLERWALTDLHRSADSVRYLPNFVVIGAPAGSIPSLPGVPGKRLVCVANMKPAKDHITLVQAMQHIVARTPDAHLLLVGGETETAYGRHVRAEIERCGVSKHVTLLGVRSDVHGILRGSDIGILSSISEGLPVALIEYGVMNLAAVATDVGQCAEVLGGGSAGVLIKPRDPHALADAVISLLENPKQARALAEQLRQRTSEIYSERAGMNAICGLYEELLRGTS